MRKQELIHLHGLFSEIATHCTDRDMPVELDEYREIGTRPTSIQHAKSDHVAAVFSLSAAVTSTLPVERSSVESARAE